MGMVTVMVTVMVMFMSTHDHFDTNDCLDCGADAVDDDVIDDFLCVNYADYLGTY